MTISWKQKWENIAILDFFLQGLSSIILFLLQNLQTLFYSILLLEEIIGDPSPDAKVATEEMNVL